MAKNRKRKQSTQRQRRGERFDASALAQFLDTDRLTDKTRRNLGLIVEETRNDSGEIVNREETLADHALMNKNGIKSVMGNFRDHVDKNQALSNYTAAEIKNLMISIHEDTARDLIVNWTRYGIENRAQLDQIIGMVTNPIYSVYKRAEDGRTLDKLAEVPQDITKTETNMGDGQKKSLLPF